MESVIKGLHLFKDVSKSDIDKMEQLALTHRQQYGIAFKILKVTDDDIIIRVTQESSPDGKYFNEPGLIGMTRLLFKPYLEEKQIKVQPVPHVLNPVDVVTAEWIQDKMLKTGTKLKDIVAESGLNKSYLSTLTNGIDPLSTMAKAFFFYYFLAKENSGLKVRTKQKKDE